MKKLFSAISLLFVGVCMCFAFAACDPTPKSILIKEGTVHTNIEVNQTLDLSNVVIRVTYSDNTYQDVTKNSEMQFSSVDTSEVGQKTLTVTYLDLQTQITINVVEDIESTYTVAGFEKPAFASLYQTNSSQVTDDPQTAEDETKNAFFEAQKSYKVGADNAFIFKPIITGYNEDYDIVTMNSLECNYKVEEKTGNNYTELTGQNLTNVVTFNNATFGFDFENAAVGKTYRLTLTAKNYASFDPISFEVEIVNGYNVHNVKELSVIDNNAATKTYWSSYKTQNNIPQDLNIDTVVLHNNINVTMQDVPTAYKYVQGDADSSTVTLGKLRQRKSIYTRDTAYGSTFTIYGNYFTIDASQIALVPIEELKRLDPNEESFGHSSLFSFGGDNHDCPTTRQGNTVIESLKIIGNANRNENTELAGGLIMVLNSSDNLLLNNTVAMSFLMNLISTTETEHWEITSTIKNSKWYDSFSNMLYYYGVKNNFIENCILKDAGGPVVFLVHVDPDKNTTTRYSNIEIKNSTLQALVEGSEAWFQYNNAAPVATDLLAMGQLIQQSSAWAKADGVITTQKSFAKNNKANLMVLIGAGDPLTNSSKVLCSVTIKDSQNNVLYTHSMSNPILDAYSAGINAAMPGAAAMLPFFQGANGSLTTVTVNAQLQPNGLGQVTQTGIVPLYTQGTASSITEQERALINSFFSGDYMGIYVNGIPSMGALAEYFDI